VALTCSSSGPSRQKEEALGGDPKERKQVEMLEEEEQLFGMSDSLEIRSRPVEQCAFGCFFKADMK
jgi:hypothetical protein